MKTNRYLRQTSLASFGQDGQAHLKAGKVLVVGLGGLGIPVVQYLNAMGVGTLGLVENDVVDLQNLQRQVLYKEADVGSKKLEIVLHRLKEQNSDTELIAYHTFLTKENALEIIENFNLVIDASDNFPTRYLINDACVLLNKPLVYGALHGFEGQVSVFNYDNGPTYRCLFPDMPTADEIPDCNVNGVLGIIPSIIGSLQAIEAVKVLCGLGDVLSGSLLLYDGLAQTTTKIKFPKNPANNITRLQDSYGAVFCDVMDSITAEEFLSLAQNQRTLLIDVRSEKEFLDDNLENATNIPLDRISEVSKELLEEKTIYLMCQSGNRSAAALTILKEKFPDLEIQHILGGLNSIRTLC